jgi:hypothetical protein
MTHQSRGAYPTTIHITDQQVNETDTQRTQQEPGSLIRNMMSQAAARSANANNQNATQADTITIGDTVYLL